MGIFKFFKDVFSDVEKSRKYYQPAFIKGIENVSNIYNYDHMPLDFSIIDIETTGLNCNVDRIIEIAIIKYRDRNVIEVFNELIDPEIPIPKSASKVNGITNKMVRGKPKIYNVIDDIFNILNNETCVVGYNVNFDLDFLNVALARGEKVIRGIEVLDILDLVKRTVGPKETENHKLETIKKYFDIELNSHRALDDCKTTFEVMKRCYKRIEDIENERRAEQLERISRLNDNEKMFITTLEEKLCEVGIESDRLQYNIMSNKMINFQIDGMQIGRVKLNGRKYKMQILDKNNALLLDIDNIEEAIGNIKHWIKYSEYLVKRRIS